MGIQISELKQASSRGCLLTEVAGGFGEFLTVLLVNKQLTREATVVRLISVKSESHPSKSHSTFLWFLLRLGIAS